MTAIVLLIFILGLTPPLLSAWISFRTTRRVQRRLGLTLEAAPNPTLQAVMERPVDEHYIEGVGYIIGDISCRLNAHSPYLRCAVNPFGPCEDCQQYQSVNFN
ncbi:MAG: DUF6464 family protein [Leptolyngbyaceae cyanobacterium MO_188.B28]|nr:DUF6464 family protein [Leptolyngbyaceae cyanobacterium MO_188.B28]